jgi:NAD(P) transhydrogenase subunit alpha
MKIAVLKETRPGENRVALTPQVAQNLIKVGYQILLEPNAGYASNFSDEAYEKMGCLIATDKANALAEADIVVKVNAPDASEMAAMKDGAVLISYLYAAFNPDLVQQLNGCHSAHFACTKHGCLEFASQFSRLQSGSFRRSQYG